MKLKPIDILAEFMEYPQLYSVLGPREISVKNPFEILYRDRFYEKNPHLAMVTLFRNPDYFTYSAKCLLNLTIPPFQAVILKELWERPFPMLLASRGASKTFVLAIYSLLKCLLVPHSKVVVCGAAFRQSKLVYDYMCRIFDESPVLKDIVGIGARQGPKRDIDRCNFFIGDSEVIFLPVGDGCLSPYSLITYDDHFAFISDGHISTDEHILKRDVKIWGNGQFNLSDEAYCKGLAPTIKITTSKGNVFEGTGNHKIKVWENMEIKWKRLDELTLEDHPILDIQPRWHNGKIEATVSQAYALGAMIGDGTYRKPYRLGFATKDKQIVEILKEGLGEFKNYESDPIHFYMLGKQKIRQWKNLWQLKQYFGSTKVLPAGILKAQKELMSACLSGLFDTDGHVISYKDPRGGIGCCVCFTNTSLLLIRQMQYILLHYGIHCSVSSRDRNARHRRVYELRITGTDVLIFQEQIGFTLERKRNLLDQTIKNKVKFTKKKSIPGVIELMWAIKKDYPNVKMGNLSLINKKSATPKLIQWFLSIFKDIDDPRLKQIAWANELPISIDSISKIQTSESIVYDVHIPVVHEYCANGFYSHNSKIRGLRATDIIAEEFAAMRKDIYEEVIAGFAAVSASPVEAHSEWARIELLKSVGQWTPEDESGYKHKAANKSIISGTASFTFNHFYEYYLKYKRIIETKGDKEKLKEILGEDVDVDQFDWRDYSIIRIPIEALPRKFMDEKIVARSRATIDKGIYMAEYGAVFPKDSTGFFKRFLIENCTATDIKPVKVSSGEDVWFDPVLKGDPTKKYIMAIDPASERDNFAILILELHSDHRRVVYCWTVNRNEHKRRITAGNAVYTDYYSYCGRKIRDLMKLFNIERIAIDMGGGGIAVCEALRDADKLQPGEHLLWPIIDYDNPKDTDDNLGLHIIVPIQFANAEFTSDANYGLRKDMQEQILLFPRFDPISIELAIVEDKRVGRTEDTFEDAIMEIEEMKNELATIVITKTSGIGRERWDTPEIKTANNKKEHMKKDRYSALLMANWVARTMYRTDPKIPHAFYGGLATGAKSAGGKMYTGPEWFSESDYSKMYGINTIEDGNSRILH